VSRDLRRHFRLIGPAAEDPEETVVATLGLDTTPYRDLFTHELCVDGLSLQPRPTLPDNGNPKVSSIGSALTCPSQVSA
jgi:hypothetical protein